MRDLMLLLVTLAAFAFGFYLMKKIDDFVAQSQRRMIVENRKGGPLIRIAAEMPAILSSVAFGLESCSAAHPYMRLFLSCGKASRILHGLLQGDIDIVLLSEAKARELGSEYAAIQILHHGDCRVYAVWNKAIQSQNRDRVLFVLENEHYRLQCGYCDYLER